MSFKTASAILRGRWLIDAQWAQAHAPILVRMMKGEAVDFGFEKPEESKEAKVLSTKAGVVYSIGYYTDVNKLPDGTIAMVNLVGPVTKYGDYCAYGSVDHVATLNRLANAGNIAGIILNVDSPGGEAAGTAMLADAVKNAVTRKPVLGFVNDGMAASAAMWIISACSEIYLSQKTDSVGSIGAYQTIADWYAYFESEGLKVRDIYAPQSTEKNLEYKEALQMNDGPAQEHLRLLVDQFIGTIRTNRAGKLTTDDWTTGKMFAAKDAIRVGLADGIKSFDQLVKRMDQLIQNKKNSSNSNNMAFQKTLVAAKAESFTVVDGGFLLEETSLNNIEASIDAADQAAALAADQLAAQTTRVTELEAAATTAAADLSQAQTALATAGTRITTLEAEVATLSQQDGQGEDAPPPTGKDSFGGKSVAAHEMDFQKELYNMV